MQGLFFPYVYFPDRVWLFSSLIYWDGIGRIVPREMQVEDSDHIKLLLEDGGVFDYPLPDSAVQKTSGSLLEVISKTEPGGVFVDNYQIADLVDTYRSLTESDLDFVSGRLISLTHRTISPAFLRSDYLYRHDDLGRAHSIDRSTPFFLHSTKFTRDAKAQLLELGLAVALRDQIGVRLDLARAYMADLANLVAGEGALMPIASAPMDFTHSGGGAVAALSDGLHHESDLPSGDAEAQKRANQEFMIHYAFRGVGFDLGEEVNRWPESNQDKLTELSRQIIRLRQRLTPYRAGFQEGISEIAADLPNLLDIRSEAVRERHLEAQYRKHVAPDLDKMREEFKSAGISFRESLLNLQVAVPSVLTGSATALGIAVDQPLLLLGGSVSAAAGTYRAAANRKSARQKTVRENRFGLLHVMEKDLAPADLLEKIAIFGRRLLKRDPLPAVEVFGNR